MTGYNMHKRPSFVVLVGLPGVGKSTYIKENALPGYRILSTDSIVEKMCAAQGITYTQGFKLFIDDATKRFNRELVDALHDKANIMIDRTNLTRNTRRRLLSQVPKDYLKFAYYFPVPEQAEWERRLNARPGKYIPRPVIDTMMSSAQFPEKEEGFTAVFTIA